jgi:hypothetical protein
MEYAAKINLKNLIILSSFLVLPLFVFGQYSKTKLSGAFAYKGNSTTKLTEDSSRQLLINDLTTGVYLSSQNTSCRSDIGLYLFKVDSQGKINKKVTFIDGSSYDEAIRKGLVPPPEVLN